MRLARELGRRETGRTLYLLDEPTTGLHFDDVRRLLDVLARLVDAGNTVVVIEHNLDVVKSADWVVDLGPEAGDAGRAGRGRGHARSRWPGPAGATRRATCGRSSPARPTPDAWPPRPQPGPTPWSASHAPPVAAERVSSLKKKADVRPHADGIALAPRGAGVLRPHRPGERRSA